MFKTIITRAPDKRICKIFKSNSQMKFKFFSYYKYEKLPLDKKFIVDIHNGYFDWIIFTSYRSWVFFNTYIKDDIINIPYKTKIAVFGPESALQVIDSGGRVDFMQKAKNASEFATKLVRLLDNSVKIAYPTSLVADRYMEDIFSEANIEIIRQNIYIPNSLLDANKIKEMIYNSDPDSIVFLSAGSAKSFMNNCSETLLKKIRNIKLFAIGPKTVAVLEEFTNSDISMPVSPDIKILSKMIYDFAANFKRG